MRPLILLALSAALVWVMSHAGVMDHPVHRSAHTRPTPKGGGVGIIAAFLVGLIWADQLGEAGAAPVALAAATLGLAAFSFLDDVQNLPFTAKLGAQAAASALVIATGFALARLRMPHGAAIDPGLWGVALSAGWLLFVTNAVNFMDGLDGLVAGAALIAALAAAGLAGNVAGAAGPALALACGLAGFLPFNWPRARIFMGDVGSQPTGFVLAVVGLAAANGRQELGCLLMPLLLAPLLLDAAFTLARRLVAGERITEAHRGHLYQVAHRAGLPAPAVAAAYWAMTLLAAVLAALIARWKQPGAAWLMAIEVGVFAVWGGFVAHRARRAGVGRW